MPYAKVNGTELYYEDYGSGPPIVFAHGRGGNHLSWWQQVPSFAHDHRCIVFDHRSFGHSQDPQSVGQDAFVADLAGLMDTLQIERAHLVAQSMGGRTCLGFALAHPGRVDRLVLAGTTAGVVDAELQHLVTAIGPAPEDLLKRVLSAGFKDREPVLTFLYRQIELLNRAGNKPTRLVARGPLRDDVKRCKTPTLFVIGDEDPLAPEPAIKLLCSWMPDARMTVIEGAGHSSYFERPSEFNRLVRAFLRP
jgi:3-oxoadipate enol-lactonase